MIKKAKPILFINQNKSPRDISANMMASNTVVYMPNPGRLRLNKVSMESAGGDAVWTLNVNLIDFNVEVIEGKFTGEEFEAKVQEIIDEKYKPKE